MGGDGLGAGAWCPAEDEVSYLHEFDTTLARLLLATGRGTVPTTGSTKRPSSQTACWRCGGGGGWERIHILVVQTLARHARGDPAGGLASLTRAWRWLSRGLRWNLRRRRAVDGRPARAGGEGAERSELCAPLPAAAVTVEGQTPAEQPLIEPLSERELEVLRLLGSELGGPDIARELVVSPNTVRTHTKSIYAKLGVNSRRAAVRRAAELSLLSRARDRRPTA